MNPSSSGPLRSSIALFSLACGSGPADVAKHAEGHHGAGAPHHFSDPDALAASWNDPTRDTWQKPDEIVAALGLSAGDTVVDLGAGTGYLVPPLSRAVGPTGQVVAADIEPAMLRFLDDATKTEGWTNVRTHASRVDSLALPAASVDHVVALNVWHHVEEREAYARDLLGTVRPGGAFVVVDFLKEATEGEGPPLSMRLSAEQVVAELTAGGFEATIVSETLPRHYVVRGVRPSGETK
ncbi:MAG: methyltransferase domain-containing protein [Myxococcota bacterium]